MRLELAPFCAWKQQVASANLDQPEYAGARAQPVLNAGRPREDESPVARVQRRLVGFQRLQAKQCWQLAVGHHITAECPSLPIAHADRQNCMLGAIA